MTSQKYVECFVGMFLIFSLAAFTVLSLKVSGLTTLFPAKSYSVIAAFDEIGGLKVSAPVKIGGVQIGEVYQIKLDPLTYKAVVKIHIRDQYREIPDDSAAGILTSGLLGDNYIAITPMYNKTYLKQGSHINDTTSAMVLEKLIGEFMYKVGNSGGGEEKKES